MFKVQSYVCDKVVLGICGRDLYFLKDMSSFAKDNFLAQINQLNSRLPSLTGLLLPNIATPRVCAEALGLQHEFFFYPFRVRWWQLLLHSPQVAWLLLKLLLTHMGSLQEF